MSKVGRVIIQYVVVPLACMIAYYLLISISLETVRAFAGEDVMKYDYAVYTLEGIVGIILCLLWFRAYRKYGFGQIPYSKGKSEDWLLAVFAALAMLGISALYFTAINKIHTPYIERSMREYNEMMEVTSSSTLAVALNLLSSCLLIPVLEEMIFRGVVFQVMLQVSHPVPAILVSGFCFGVMHGQVIQIGYAFLCGIVLAVVYYVSKNLVMSIATHMLFNFVGSGIYEVFNPSEVIQYILEVVEYAAIPIFIIMVILLIRFKKKQDKKSKMTVPVESKGEQ